MKLVEIEHEAMGLSEHERATLIVNLITTLPAPAVDVSDEEVMRRDAEMENGSVKPLSQEEFLRRINRGDR